jgi:hypothetical protein
LEPKIAVESDIGHKERAKTGEYELKLINIAILLFFGAKTNEGGIN